MGDPTPPTPYTRAVALGIVPFLVVASVMLYLLPTRTEQLFAWTIAPPVSAMFLGSAYVGGIVFFIHVARAARWEQVQYGFPAVLLFSVLLAIATVLHWDRFHFGHLSFIVWATLYAVTPALVAGVLVVQHSRTRRQRAATPDSSGVAAKDAADDAAQEDAGEVATDAAGNATTESAPRSTYDVGGGPSVDAARQDDRTVSAVHDSAPTSRTATGSAGARSDLAEGVVPWVARIAFAALGLAALVVGIVMFVAPAVFIDTWAWPLTPLTARVTGAVLTLPGMVNVWMLREGRWSLFCRIFDAEILSLVFLAGALVLARGNIEWARPAASVVTVGLAASLVSYVAFWLYCRRRY